MLSFDPFQRITAGGTFHRTYQIFAAKYRLFLVISGIIFVPLALVYITMSQILGSSMHTVIDGMNYLHDLPQQEEDLNAFFNITYDDNIIYDDQNSLFPSDDQYSLSPSDDQYSLFPFSSSSTATANSSDAIVQQMNLFRSLSILEYIVRLILTIAGKAAMSFAVAEIYVGRDPSWLECFKKGMSRWCALFGGAMLVGLGVVLCNLVVDIVIVILLVMQINFMTFLSFVILVAWLVVLTFVMVSIMILAPVIMVEGSGPINAIKRCWELSRNNRCYIFCTSFCLGILYLVCQMVLTAILYVVGGLDAVYSIPGAFLVVLPALIYVPLQVIAETVVYLNIRVQFEGLNHSVLFAELHGDEQQAPASNEPKYGLVSKSEGFV